MTHNSSTVPAQSAPNTLDRRVPSRPLTVFIASAVLILACLVTLSLFVGAHFFRPAEVVAGLLGESSGSTAREILLARRIPRTIAALLAGAGLAMAGCVLQIITRNPLADTGVFGMNAGAAFAAALALSALGLSSPPAFTAAALVGAGGTMMLVTRLGRDASGSVDPLQIVLAGVAVSAVFEGLSEGMSLLDPQTFARIKSWMVGSLDVAAATPLYLMSTGLSVSLVALVFLAPRLAILPLGESTAKALGVHVARTRALALLVVSLLAATVTAAVGVLAFVGLVVPHLVRQAGITNERDQIWVSGLTGPILLLAADILGRLLLPGELPAGVTVAIIGAPFLIFLAQRKQVTL